MGKPRPRLTLAIHLNQERLEYFSWTTVIGQQTVGVTMPCSDPDDFHLIGAFDQLSDALLLIGLPEQIRQADPKGMTNPFQGVEAGRRHAVFDTAQHRARHFRAFAQFGQRQFGCKPKLLDDFAYALFERKLDAFELLMDSPAGLRVIALPPWWTLRWLGHDNCALLDGGYLKWVAEGWPVTAAIPDVLPGRFEPHPRPDATVDVGYVQAHHASSFLRIIDARTPERYRGEQEPIDPVAGHIPGAVNRWFKNNLLADGTFKPAATLAAEFKALLGDRDPRNVVHQCGSGVTACHNLLAMEVAGLPGARLYAGSWSEWCSDPARPVACQAPAV